MTEKMMEVERVAYGTWPAEVVQGCDGWLMRWTRGVTGRANSVWPNGDNGRLPLGAKVEAAEAFYSTYDRPTIFQLNPVSQPPELAQVLAERGYRSYDKTLVQTAVLNHDAFAHLPLNGDVVVQQGARLDDVWLNFHQASNGYSDEATAVRADIMGRIVAPTAYATAWLAGELVGIGTGLVQDGWLCVLNMRTAEGCEKRGVGTAVLTHLLRWGGQLGATRTFLQVTAVNHPAHRLYQKFGYQTMYAYRYWTNEMQG